MKTQENQYMALLLIEPGHWQQVEGIVMVLDNEKQPATMLE